MINLASLCRQRGWVGAAFLQPCVRPGATPAADEALGRLADGRWRFAGGRPEYPDQSLARRTELVAAQHPVAVVITCAHSRLSPKFIFDRGLGDLFVLRPAGERPATGPMHFHS